MAIVEFYIQNYSWNNSVVTTETKFHEVPFNGEPPITNPKVKNEIGKAGSFEFGLEMNSPYYNAMLQMKTILRVTYFGYTIFRGRVLTIDKTLARTRTVHCEGDFAFLLDSHQIATKEDTRPEIGVLTYLQQIITQHNTDMGDENIKKFTLGEVPGQYTNAAAAAQRVNIPTDKATQKFGDSSWNTSMDRIEGLLSDFGGYFRTRYNAQTGVTYLDWFDKYYNATTNTQTIEVTKNLIDLSGPTEVENLFTIVIPVGKKNSDNVFISDYWPIVSSSHAKVNYIMVPELATVPLYSDNELNSDYHRKVDYQNAVSRFGRIWKTVDFENADTPEKLFNYAKDWIKNNFMPEITQWDVSALDMKIVNPANQVLLCGDRVALTHPEVDTTYNGLTIISADYDLYNPDKNKYKIGIPNQEINASYGVKKKSGGGGGGGGGGISDKPDDTDNELAMELERLKNKLRQDYVYKSEMGGDITLDNPLSYVTYNTDATEKEKKTALTELMDTSTTLLRTKTTKFAEVFAEALRRGVSTNDTQLLIDLTPTEKAKQDRFRAQTGAYLNTQVGMSLQETNVILYETAGQSHLASLVDDEGNWTPYAYSQGAGIWRDSENIRQQALNTKQILNGTKTTPTTSTFVDQAASTFEQFVNGDSLNIFNGLNADKVIDSATGLFTEKVNIFGDKINHLLEEKNATSGTGTWEQASVDFMGIFMGNTTESDGKEAEVSSDTLEIDGNSGQGTIEMGVKVNNQWPVTANKPITYTNSSGQTVTMYNAMHADDYHLDSIGSVKADLIACEVLLADYAQIGTLVSLEARVGSIEADYVSTGTLYADIANLTSVNMQAVTFASATSERGGISVYSVATTSFSQGGVSCYFPTAPSSVVLTGPVNDVYTLTVTNFSGTPSVYTFSRATSLSGVWSGGVLTVDATPQGEQLKATVDAVMLNGTASYSSTNNNYTIPIKVMSKIDGGSQVATGFTANLIQSATEAYNAGWNACRNAASGATVLSGYSTYASGRSVELFLADGTSAGTHVWRYGGSTGTRYTLPSPK